MSAEEVELAEIKHDLFWENWKTNSKHELTLVQIALNKPNPDQKNLFLCHQFIRAFHILAKFSIHINKPLNSLFDCSVSNYLINCIEYFNKSILFIDK